MRLADGAPYTRRVLARSQQGIPAAARVALVLGAFACAAWLAVSWRNESLQSAANRHLSEGPAGAVRAESDLRSAKALNAGLQPDLQLVSALAAQGRPSEALEVAAGITRSEPDNLAAWVLLSDLAAQSGDQDLALYARQRARDLAARPSG